MPGRVHTCTQTVLFPRVDLTVLISTKNSTLKKSYIIIKQYVNNYSPQDGVFGIHPGWVCLVYVLDTLHKTL